jgi:hypothetical protein
MTTLLLARIVVKKCKQCIINNHKRKGGIVTTTRRLELAEFNGSNVLIVIDYFTRFLTMKLVLDKNTECNETTI